MRSWWLPLSQPSRVTKSDTISHWSFWEGGGWDVCPAACQSAVHSTSILSAHAARSSQLPFPLLDNEIQGQARKEQRALSIPSITSHPNPVPVPVIVIVLVIPSVFPAIYRPSTPPLLLLLPSEASIFFPCDEAQSLSCLCRSRVSRHLLVSPSSPPPLRRAARLELRQSVPSASSSRRLSFFICCFASARLAYPPPPFLVCSSHILTIKARTGSQSRYLSDSQS